MKCIKLNNTKIFRTTNIKILIVALIIISTCSGCNFPSQYTDIKKSFISTNSDSSLFNENISSRYIFTSQVSNQSRDTSYTTSIQKPQIKLSPSAFSGSKISSGNSSSSSNNSIIEYKMPEPNSDDGYDIENAETDIVNITSEQLKKIRSGASYEDIISELGKSLNYSTTNITVYTVDSNKLLVLVYQNINDISPYSGEQLIAKAAKIQNEFNNNKDTGFCVVITKIGKDTLYVCNPLYDFLDGRVFRYHNFTAYITVDTGTQILFQDGRKGTLDDIDTSTGIVVTYYDVDNNYAPQRMKASKIIIL